MAFKTYGNSNSESGPRMTAEDFKKLETHVIEAAGLQEETTLVGVISSIVDLGIQPQDDAKIEWTGTPEEEAAEIEKNSNTYFEDLFDYEDKKTKRYKRFPSKDTQCVAMTVDFPDIIVDKGQFFGNSQPLPLRLLLGGDFTPKGGKNIVARPLALTMRKNEKTNNVWSFPFNHTLYKMAIAAGLVKKGEGFLPENIDQLLGKSLQFKAQVFMKDDKFFTEKCAFAAALARGQKAFEVDVSTLSMIQFDEDNKAEDIKTLRASIKNTIRRASNFEGSKIKEQIGEGYVKGDKPATPEDTPEEVVTEGEPDVSTTTEPELEGEPDFLDDDLPF